MKRIIAIFIFAAALICMTGCRSGGSPRGDVPAAGTPVEAYDILAAYYGSHEWGETEYAFAKMLTPATAASRGEAEVIFFASEFGEKVWTNHYFRSRPAGKGDLKKGAVVFFTKFDPATPEERMKSGWLLGVIENTTELDRGFIAVTLYSPGFEGSKTKRKALNNIRLPLEKLSPLSMPK